LQRVTNFNAVGSHSLRIAVHQLGKAYGYFWALRDLELEIPAGECVALLGPNGAGKTTFLRLLSGLIYPTQGEIEFEGTKFSRSSIELRSGLGFLAPSEHLYENLTVRENLDFFTALYNKRAATASIDEALAAVGLERWAGEYVSALSSGMKCRLSIATWRLLDPGLLLLDEPYGVLDGGGVDLLKRSLSPIVARADRHPGLTPCLAGAPTMRPGAHPASGKIDLRRAAPRPWTVFNAPSPISTARPLMILLRHTTCCSGRISSWRFAGAKVC
jgi:ABC-type transport system involved in cytochrome c biogenesis ATPase subunit